VPWLNVLAGRPMIKRIVAGSIVNRQLTMGGPSAGRFSRV
jgi:hypothetical protein